MGQSIAIGIEAPNFTLPDPEGRPVSLRQFRGKKNVLLVFYVKDSTSG